MIFAESESFWKSPSVYDVAGLVGVVLGIGSIWYAWYLARRQLRADLRKATEDAIERLNQLSLGGDLSEAIRFLRDADRAVDERDWTRGMMRLDDAVAMVARLTGNLNLQHNHDFTEQLIALRRLHERIREHRRSAKNRAYLQPSEFSMLSELIILMERLRGKLHQGSLGKQPEVPDDG